MKKTYGNIEIEIHDAADATGGDAFLVYLSIRSSTIKQLNILPTDAWDLVHALNWALGRQQKT